MPTARATPDAFDRARKIKLLLYDVDGVLTDGTIWIVPTGAGAAHADQKQDTNGDGGFGFTSQTMAEAKGFYAHDGIGVSLGRIAGIETGFITKRVSEAVKARATDLKLNHVYLGQANKLDAVHRIMQETGLTLEQIAYAGDDIVDLPVMRVCGLAVAVPNARPEVLTAAHYITEHEGGKGAGRDVIDFILKARGILDKVVEQYIASSHSGHDIGVGNM